MKIEGKRIKRTRLVHTDERVMVLSPFDHRVEVLDRCAETQLSPVLLAC